MLISQPLFNQFSYCFEKKYLKSKAVAIFDIRKGV